MWIVTRYDDVLAVARDHGTFSSALSNGGILIPGKTSRELPQEADPPESVGYRNLLNAYFSPSAAAWRETRMREIASEQLDEFTGAGRCDLRRQFSVPYMERMTYELVGFPLDRMPRAQARLSPFEDHEADIPRLTALIDDVLADARAGYGSGLTAMLLDCEIDGRKLNDQELHDILRNVHNGGVHTVTDSLSNILVYLAEHPADFQRLTDDTGLRSRAIEEFLRWRSPVMALARTAVKDVNIGGAQLRAGDRVLIFWASANHDEREFAQPEEVVLDRRPNRHIAFGSGIHRCLGSNIARSAITVALDLWLERVTALRVTRARHSDNAGITYGWLEVDLEFTAR